MLDQQHDSIEALADRWLAAERRSAARSIPDVVNLDPTPLDQAYDRAIKEASEEDLLEAWESARLAQSASEVASAAWFGARRIIDLLGSECRARARS